jgi:sulfatase modifying factor 1
VKNATFRGVSVLSGLALAGSLGAACTSSIGPAISADGGLAPPDAANLDASAALADASLPTDGSALDGSFSPLAPDAATADAGLADALPPLDVVVPVLPPTTATMTGPGLDTCGVTPGPCAQTLGVPGGTYAVSISSGTPATVSPYRLDKFKVTVGRFRKFTEAWLGGWRPAAADGKHVHVNGGRGLARTEGGFEAGWQSAWNGWVGSRSEAQQPLTSLDASTWNTSLACTGTIGTSYAAWTPTAASHESWPINCVSWYEAQAFCIWDGGFLPSEIEWDFAVVGGTEGRSFPWGAGAVDPTRALYGVQQLAPVGLKPAGDGRWGHSDMLGMLSEFVYDVSVTNYAANCTDCAHDSVNGMRTTRGTNFRSSDTTLGFVTGIGRSGLNVGQRAYHVGFRCARP